MKNIIFYLTAMFLVANAAIAQMDTSSSLKISGYIEAYYQYDAANPVTHERPNFVYSHNRHNEVNLNIGIVKAAYQSTSVRGNVALMTGTYANSNLAAEPGVLKNIFEANVGVKLASETNIWADAGIFASHIGFESAIGADCWTATRSILADNSPYYLAGAKISYTTEDNSLFISGLLLNGWQRIQRVNGNQTPAFGHQVTWMPNEQITFNSSSFIGSDTPDSIRAMRYFHNFYAKMVFENFGIILGFDIGAQHVHNSSDYNIWYAPVVIVRYILSETTALAARIEHYNDKSGVIIPMQNNNSVSITGFSLNYDIRPAPNVLFRIEGKYLQNGNGTIFHDSDGNPTDKNVSFITSMSVAF